jgi:hypothetical protein
MNHGRAARGASGGVESAVAVPDSSPRRAPLTTGVEGQRRGERDDPQRARQLHGGGHLEGVGPVGHGGAHHRAGVVDGHGAPQPELVGVHAERVPHQREDQQGHGVEREHRAERRGHLMRARRDGGRHGGDGAAPADGRAGGDQQPRQRVHSEEPRERPAEREAQGDAAHREARAQQAHVHHGAEIQARAEAHHREHQQALGQRVGLGLPHVQAGEGHRHAQHQRAHRAHARQQQAQQPERGHHRAPQRRAQRGPARGRGQREVGAVQRERGHRQQGAPQASPRRIV